ncbi:MAG: type III pantothenate kinase [Bacteroidota bacterium]
MNLVIDIGNTTVKGAVFENNRLITSNRKDSLNDLLPYLGYYLSSIQQCIVSTVRDLSRDELKNVKKHPFKILFLDHQTPVPIENLYRGKSTLGYDRLAAAVGASNIFPLANVLVIDAGTAITYDFINDKNQYLGGNISPGIETRFKALHQFTGRLPLVKINDNYMEIGDKTEEAIRSGVQQGVIFEVEGYINHFKEKFSDLKIVVSGGDAIFFDKRLKNSIFVNQNLVLTGLNRILEYNAEKI